MPADTATLDAPPSAHDVFKSVETFETPNPRPAQTTPDPAAAPAAKTEAGAPEPPKGGTTNSEGQTTVDKPEAMKAKSSLDKLGKVAKPEVEKKVEAKPNGTDPSPAPAAVDLGHAGKLREAYDKQGQDMAALRAELEKIRPDAAKVTELRTELEGSRAELAKLKAMQLNDEERKRFDGLREMHARYETENSTEFQQKIMAPIQMRVQKIEAIAKKAGIEGVAFQALKDAMDQPDELDRSRGIRQALRGVENMDADDYTDYYASLTGVGKELHEQYLPQMEAKLKNAGEIEQAARTREKEQAEQKTTADKAEFQKERDYVHKLLAEDSLKPLMEDTDLAIDGVTLAEAMQGAEAPDNARDRAYQAHAGAVLPFTIQYANKLLAKIHALEQANKIRNGAAPSRSDAVQKAAADADRDRLTAEQVFRSNQSMGPGMRVN